MSEREQRRETRARVRLPAQLVRHGALEPVEIVDASLRGLFLRMPNPPPVRQLVQLRVRLQARTIDLYAVVVRIVGDALPGVGLRLFALNGGDKVEWEGFISKAVANRGTRAA